VASACNEKSACLGVRHLQLLRVEQLRGSDPTIGYAASAAHRARTGSVTNSFASLG